MYKSWVSLGHTKDYVALQASARLRVEGRSVPGGASPSFLHSREKMRGTPIP